MNKASAPAVPSSSIKPKEAKVGLDWRRRIRSKPEGMPIASYDRISRLLMSLKFDSVRLRMLRRPAGLRLIDLHLWIQFPDASP